MVCSKTVIIVLILAVCSVSQFMKTDLNTPPKLPLFIGKGYDILLGNPLSTAGVDPGFRHQIFQFTYNKSQTTQDGKYLLPDGMAHRKTTACTFSTKINQYRGTQSYQSELKTKAQIGGGYSGPLFKASFSHSITYEKVHNQTMSQNMSLTQASAECQCYEMSLDVFKPRPITPNFWQGVKNSYTSKNWDKFIEQFGTHYVYEVIMGGRAIQQIQYASSTISQLETMSIDINIAAKASFAKFFSDASFDYHKYQEQISYAKTLSRSIQQIYIGGRPPKTGKIMEWQQEVVKDPMPITYKMIPLSDLFQFTTDKSIDVNVAKQHFLQALDHYCNEKGCHEPTPDKPKPHPATVETMKTQLHGGEGGDPFDWSHVNPIFNARKIQIRAGAEIDGIQIQLSDGVTTVLSPKFGGQGGGEKDPWPVPEGEHITQVQFRSGKRIDSIGFVTNKGTRSPQYGGGGGSYSMLEFPEGYRIVGLYGRAGSRLDKLGFILGKTVFHNGAPMTITKNLLLNDQ